MDTNLHRFLVVVVCFECSNLNCNDVILAICFSEVIVIICFSAGIMLYVIIAVSFYEVIKFKWSCSQVFVSFCIFVFNQNFFATSYKILHLYSATFCILPIEELGDFSFASKECILVKHISCYTLHFRLYLKTHFRIIHTSLGISCAFFF